MPLPAGDPTSTALVKAHLKINDNVDDDAITRAVDAVNLQVRRLPAALELDVDPAPAEWPADHTLGATMLAARLFTRRNTPNGVEGFTESFAVYVRRNDPDVAALLSMGSHARPVLG